MKVIQQIFKVSIALLLLTIIVTSPYMHDHHDSIVDEECPVFLLELVLVMDAFLFELTSSNLLNSSPLIINHQITLNISTLIVGFTNKAPPAAA